MGGGGGGYQKQKFLKEGMELNRYFQRGEGAQTKTLSMGEVSIFSRTQYGKNTPLTPGKGGGGWALVPLL